jgi:hypothetical protein
LDLLHAVLLLLSCSPAAAQMTMPENICCIMTINDIAAHKFILANLLTASGLLEVSYWQRIVFQHRFKVHKAWQISRGCEL